LPPPRSRSSARPSRRRRTDRGPECRRCSTRGSGHVALIDCCDHPLDYLHVLLRHRPRSIAARLAADQVGEPLGKCSRPDSAARRIQIAMIGTTTRPPSGLPVLSSQIMTAVATTVNPMRRASIVASLALDREALSDCQRHCPSNISRPKGRFDPLAGRSHTKARAY
jgi:hypothetical protein